jgi:hypothetical protein
MSRIRVHTDGGRIRIRLSEESKTPVDKPTGAETLKSLPKPATAANNRLILSNRLINLIEIRVESGFRPKEDDVEIVYALSGSNSNVFDMLHKLSSQTVVEEAAEDYVISSVQGMIEHIVKERGNNPGLIAVLHTHPRGISKPSNKDKLYFHNASETIKTLLPGVNVLFGVHAISSESIRERKEPSKISKNTIKWSSITREHEIAFFTSDTNMREVDLIE